SDGVVVLHRESEVRERSSLWFRTDIFPPGSQPRSGSSRNLGCERPLPSASRSQRSGRSAFLSRGKNKSCRPGNRWRKRIERPHLEWKLADSVGRLGPETAGHRSAVRVASDAASGKVPRHSWRTRRQPKIRRSRSRFLLHFADAAGSERKSRSER